MGHIKDYYKINEKMWFISESLYTPTHECIFEQTSEYAINLYENGFTPLEIGDFLEIPEFSVITILKQEGFDCKSNELSVVTIKGIPGVSQTETGEYSAHIWHNNEKIELGVYKNKFKAAVARYQAELEYGFEGVSKAVKYMKEQCSELDCDLCYVHDLKLLPMVCKRAKRLNAAKQSTETFDEFLIRAKKVVSEKLKENKS